MNISGAVLAKNNPEIVAKLVAITNRVAAKDSTIWGPETEAANRLNWVDLPTKSRQLLPKLDALSAWARSNKLTEIVLCGMGGSSLAPEVIARTYNKELTIVDTTDPAQIANSVPKNLSNSVVIIGSKSGTTIEVQSQFMFYKEI
ncbi:MAG: glucose-6-phosphate isomerase, partial [Actinobacteria bacterium]|nr:glucose-6-phosphate isomerase [Actinomycetota bacterium]